MIEAHQDLYEIEREAEGTVADLLPQAGKPLTRVGRKGDFNDTKIRLAVFSSFCWESLFPWSLFS